MLDLVLPTPSGDLTSFLIAFVPTVWSPTIIAVVFVLVGGGVAALRQELKARVRYHRGAARWLVLAVILPIVAVAAALLSARAVGDAAPFTPASGLPLMIGIQIITGAIGEELGWRGCLLPRLRTFVGVTPSFWIMGTLWSLWHVPAFFDPSLPHYTMPMWLVLLTVVFFGVFMGFVFNRAGESVLATMAAHLSLNIMLGLGGAALSSPMLGQSRLRSSASPPLWSQSLLDQFGPSQFRRIPIPFSPCLYAAKSGMRSRSLRRACSVPAHAGAFLPMVATIGPGVVGSAPPNSAQQTRVDSRGHERARVQVASRRYGIAIISRPLLGRAVGTELPERVSAGESFQAE